MFCSSLSACRDLAGICCESAPWGREEGQGQTAAGQAHSVPQVHFGLASVLKTPQHLHEIRHWRKIEIMLITWLLLENMFLSPGGKNLKYLYRLSQQYYLLDSLGWLGHKRLREHLEAFYWTIAWVAFKTENAQPQPDGFHEAQHHCGSSKAKDYTMFNLNNSSKSDTEFGHFALNFSPRSAWACKL